MKTTNYYRITYACKNGLSYKTIKKNTLEEVNAFVEEYKVSREGDKYYRVDEAIITKGKTRKDDTIIVKTIETWLEED